MDTGSVQDAITGVATQSRADDGNEQWVSSYKVAVSNDASSWTPVDGGVTFSGNPTPQPLNSKP
jgi:hypothetical protein